LTPTKGKVIWQGQNITGKPVHRIVKKGITRTFQLTKLLKNRSALDNVVIGRHLHVGMGFFEQLFKATATEKKEIGIKEKALDLLELIGIELVKHEPAGSLPHGYQRALNIAIALATEPKLLLLDEPTTGMNPVETDKLMAKIKMLRDEKGITIFLVEHDMKAVMNNCDKITVMSFGDKIAEGSPEEISSNEEVIEAYLGR
jgi:branched-chain amino acid transport system ATP-binding protein